MLRRPLWLIGVCIFVFSSAPSTSAQEVSAPQLPLVEASAGYAYMRDTTTEENFPAGWYFSDASSMSSLFSMATTPPVVPVVGK